MRFGLGACKTYVTGPTVFASCGQSPLPLPNALSMPALSHEQTGPGDSVPQSRASYVVTGLSVSPPSEDQVNLLRPTSRRGSQAVYTPYPTVRKDRTDADSHDGGLGGKGGQD